MRTLWPGCWPAGSASLQGLRPPCENVCLACGSSTPVLALPPKTLLLVFVEERESLLFVGQLLLDTMAGVNVDRFSDSEVGRFIDRLDHVQFKLVKPLSNDVTAMVAQVATVMQDMQALEKTIAAQAGLISSLQKVSQAHSTAISDHEARLGLTAHQLGRLTAPSVASHRGQGTIAPASSP